MRKVRKLLGENIAMLREKNGFTQDRLATMLGLTRGTINRIEKGKQTMRDETLSKIAAIFNVDETVLFQVGIEAAIPSAPGTSYRDRLLVEVVALDERLARELLEFLQHYHETRSRSSDSPLKKKAE